MAEVKKDLKAWVGFVSADLPHVATADAWLIVSDFFNADKWLPIVAECHKVEDAGEGVIMRLVIGTPGEDGKPLYWAKEQLIEKDDISRSILCKITDNDLGYRRYLSGMKVVPGGGSGEVGCKIEWSYDTDPIEGSTVEEVIEYMQSALDGMAKRIEEALVKNSFSGASA